MVVYEQDFHMYIEIRVNYVANEWIIYVTSIYASRIMYAPYMVGILTQNIYG